MKTFHSGRLASTLFSGLVAAALLAPQIARADENWTLASPATSPSARSGGCMAYDSLHQKTVLFGGITGNSSELGDTWLWDGTTWSPASPATTPAPRGGCAMVYDSGHQQIVMFGGTDGAGVSLADTWIWDGTNWSMASPARSPLARGEPAMAYDSALQEVVLFGGYHVELYVVPSFPSDTWIWDGTNWTQQSPASSPPPRYEAAMAFDGTHVVLFGGYYYVYPTLSVFGDTWAWDGANGNWILQNPSQAPSPRTASTMSYDALQGQIVLFGGSSTSGLHSDTWLWSSNNWTQLSPATSPPPRGLGMMAFDSARQQTVLFGGLASGSASADTWLLGSASTQTAVTITVPAGIQFTFNGKAYTGSQTINVAPGNYPLSTNSPQATGAGSQAVWVSWDDSGAQSHSVTVGSSAITITGTYQTQYLLATSVSPAGAGLISPGSGFYNVGAVVSVTESPSLGSTFSGWGGACSGTGACSVTMNAPASVAANFTVNLANITINVPVGVSFSLNGTTYTGSQTIALPPGSYPLSTISPQVTAPNTRAVWLAWSDAGAQTHQIAAPSVVTGTYKTQYFVGTLAAPGGTGTVTPDAYYDAGSLAILSATPNPGYEFDYWALDCSGSLPSCLLVVDSPKNATAVFGRVQNWVQLFPTKSPQPRNSYMMTYDGRLNQVVLFGGGQSGLPVFGDTWIWDGSNWTQRSSVGAPGRSDGTMAYDPASGQVLLFGGISASSASWLSDTWVWDGTLSTWTQLNPTSIPAARTKATMAFDGHEIIMFGGNGFGNNLLGDTWLWNGHNWVLQHPATSPQARDLAAMAFDPGRQRVVLFGGLGATPQNISVPLSDTWEWDGTSWTQKPAITHPGTSVGTMAYNEASRQVLFFGDDGSTWGWDGHTWIQKTPVTSPPARGLTSMVYDAVHHEVVLFGGWDNGTDHLYKDTWAWMTPVIDPVPQAPVVTKGGGNYVVTMGLQNQGNVPITSLFVSDATLAGVVGKSSGFVSLISPGTSSAVSAKFSASFPPGTFATVVFSGVYNADGIVGIPWSANFQVKLP